MSDIDELLNKLESKEHSSEDDITQLICRESSIICVRRSFDGSLPTTNKNLYGYNQYTAIKKIIEVADQTNYYCDITSYCEALIRIGSEYNNFVDIGNTTSKHMKAKERKELQQQKENARKEFDDLLIEFVEFILNKLP